MISIGNQTSWAATPTLPFEYAVANAFDAFEWFPDKKPGAGWDDNDLDPARRSSIRETARERRVRLSVHARWQANPLQAECHAMLAKDLQLAIDLGAVLFNIHLFHEAGLEAFIKAIMPLTRSVAEAGLQLSIENTPDHPPELFNELFARLRTLDTIPENTVGMCLDLGHANLCSATQNDYLRFVDRLEPRVPIIHLHLHENWGDADRHLPLFTGPAAQNDSGIRGFLARMQRRHFAGSIILEQWPQPPTLLNQARDRLRKLLGEEASIEPRALVAQAAKSALTPTLSHRMGEGDEALTPALSRPTGEGDGALTPGEAPSARRLMEPDKGEGESFSQVHREPSRREAAPGDREPLNRPSSAASGLLSQVSSRPLRPLREAQSDQDPSAREAPSVFETPQNEQAFVEELVAADKRSRSWREKLAAVHQLLVGPTAHQLAITHHPSPITNHASPVTDRQSSGLSDPSPITLEQLAYVAIYLRFLSTGEIPCSEDGRHFRPGHHADISRKIQERLAGLCRPDTAFIMRRILPWLPSSAPTFRRAEPLTRIRDIAHRNDIPSELKREIKHSLQNKLHRCAGPEDLATSAALLERISAPETGYPPGFVEQFRIFHDELKEFFNALSLDERLKALLPQSDDQLRELIQGFLSRKSEASAVGRQTLLELLTRLRRELLENGQNDPMHGVKIDCRPLPPEGGVPRGGGRRLQAADAGTSDAAHGQHEQESLLADIALEEFAFVLLSQILNERVPQFGPMLDVLSLTITNLELSSVAPEECRALVSELRAWGRELNPKDREQLLRLKATVERCRRLADDFSQQILALFPGRVQKLGRALGVAEHAIRVFCEAEIRGHVVFQLSKLVSSLLRQLRQGLALPPWDVLVSGHATGHMETADSLAELAQDQTGPVIALLKTAEGDEEIPKAVRGIVLGHPIPHLSHLGVRARQAGVVFVSSEEPAEFEKLRLHEGQTISLTASPEKVKWTVESTKSLTAAASGSAALRPPSSVPVRLERERSWMALEEVSLETGGGKADGARRLIELARRPGAGFQVPSGIVIPFGVMEAGLRAVPELEGRYHNVLTHLDQVYSQHIDSAVRSLRELVRQVKVPDTIVSALAGQFGPSERFFVRSSANCEDLEGSAGAGLYDSVGNVALPEIASSVQTVWASLWTTRAARSRSQAGIAHRQAHMAVLIQRMLAPDYAFVIHTINPLNLNPAEVYIELVVGLGETLVSASTQGTPYRLISDKAAGTVTTQAFANFSHGLLAASGGAIHSVKTDCGPLPPEGGVPRREERRLQAADAGTSDPVYSERRVLDYSRVELSRERTVRNDLVGKLTGIARRVEEHFRKPQDIEGCVAGKEIYLVQSRPQQGLLPEGH
jgi:phosphoglucan,water dikinase